MGRGPRGVLAQRWLPWPLPGADGTDGAADRRRSPGLAMRQTRRCTRTVANFTNQGEVSMRTQGSCRTIALLCLVGLAGFAGSVQAQAPAPKPSAGRSAAVPAIDSALVGVWGVDAQGGYEFRADGTFIMEGSVRYAYDASAGTWHYWQPGMEMAKVTAEYRVSADRKSLDINLHKGRPFTHLVRIK
jgi:hypothetical protein